ncbi:twitchin-like isoform X3 [Haliotis rubra]|uniref:twitchin-like isoform X3 n=1 Tax=Haliotis rubra TaxID=36100 RepID=UPI001EE5FB65|nr:twitchin-like isoform X3 [Haliotis rubra]
MGRLVVVAVVCFVVVSGTVHDDTEVSELREEVKELKQILQHSGITRRETDEEITIEKPPPPGLFLVGTTRTTVELVITPPPNYGDRGVTWYQVRHTTSGSDVNYDVKGELMDPRHFLLTGLMPDTQYTILVRAGYDAEYGETANVTATTLRRTLPSAPVVTIGEVTKNSVELLISKPASDEDIDIDAYLISFPKGLDIHRYAISPTPPVTRFVVNGSLTLPVVVHAGSRRQNGPDLLVLASPLIDHTEHRG